MLWVLLGGCEVIEDLLPDPPCEDVVEVDAVTGSAELVLDPTECVGEDFVANRVEYATLADEDWEPLVAPGADPCNTGSVSVLSIRDLPPGERAVDPSEAPTYASDFVDGVWMKVQYWDHKASAATWSTYFRFGYPEDVVVQAICLEND